MLLPAQHMAPATPVAPAAVRSLSIVDTGMVPSGVVVAPGTLISWRNDGTRLHTSTADDGRWDSPALAPGDRFAIAAPSVPGVYAYHCRFHSYMRGTITVSLLSLATPATVPVGGRPTLSGTVPGAAAGTVVTLQRRAKGAWEVVAEATTDASGAYRVSGPPISARAAFRAVAGDAVSPSVKASARPVVVLRRTGAALTVRVDPAGGGRARLQRLDLDTYRWRTVATARLAGGRARFRIGGAGVYRALVEARGGLAAAASHPVPLRTGTSFR